MALPAGCRHDEGPGTLDAICSTELDPEKSAKASAASALVLEVGVEPVAGRCGQDAGRPGAALRRGRSSRPSCRKRSAASPTGHASRSTTPSRFSKTARVVVYGRCRLPRDQVPWASASAAPSVQVLITPGMRYRLMARAPKEDFEQRKEAVDAFFASFRILP